MEVSDHLHAPAALSTVPIGQEAGLAPEEVWTRWVREINPITAPTGNWIPALQSVY